MQKAVVFLLLTASIASSQPSTPVSPPAFPDSITWHTVSDWGVEGRGWTDVKQFYDRLTAKAVNGALSMQSISGFTPFLRFRGNGEMQNSVLRFGVYTFPRFHVYKAFPWCGRK